MLDVCLLGTAGMLPLPNRFLTSLLLRYQGNLFLIDCGEGTQVSLRMQGWGLKQLGCICITHFHADHIAGLPGLLLTIGNSGRTEPLTIIGPAGLTDIVSSLCIIAPELPFTVQCIEITDDTQQFIFGHLTISILPVKHCIPCFAYRFNVQRQPKFLADKAKQLNIPVSAWSLLQSGKSVQINDITYLPSDVLDHPRRGIQVCYATDLRPSPTLEAFAKESDLFICEGNYAEDDQLIKAKKNKHCLFSESAQMAKHAQVKKLWLTHFSAALDNPNQFLSNATEIFLNTIIGYDRLTETLRFPEE